MDAFESFLSEKNIQEENEKAVQLNDVESKSDPETEPFKSKYAAREIWQGIKNDIDKISPDSGEGERGWVFLLAGLDLKLGCNYMETEELSSGEERLTKCIEALRKYKLDEKACTTLQNALNQVGILWASRRRPEEALKFLEEAQEIYKSFKKEVGNAPHKPEEIFCVAKEEDMSAALRGREDAFESTYTHTLYYLAQVYGNLEENDKSAEYCHWTLRRQLDSLKYDPMDWALNAATLSQYYITRGNFNMARHCLASASVIINEVEEPTEDPNLDPNSQQALDIKEKVPRSKCDINRCWIKYCIALLEASRDRLYSELETDEETDGDHNAEGAEGNEPIGANGNEQDEKQDEEKKSDLFFNLEVTNAEEKVTDKYLNTFDQAREVFLVGQKWCNSSKEFYVLDGHCSDHIEIVQDHSKLFKTLAFFEPDFERQCKMHKRRIDMMEAVLKEISMQFYLLICRQLMYEIAETYSAMLDLKLSIMEESGASTTPHAVKKINHLADQSIKKFEQYINTLRNTQKQIPDKLCDDDERPALVAFFCIGRLYSKFMEGDVQKRLYYLNKSKESYQFLVDYCHKHPGAAEKMKAELDICEEMVTLLPMKMERIRLNAEL